MNKHGRKNGITAHKFMIEIHMTKVELKLAQQCRISVIFKRGEHKKETVNAPVLDKGVAYFDEKLAVPSIFYFDEARNAFLSKEATLALNMISSKAQRLMGVTKFDLSVYLNSGMKDSNVDLKMEKCFDKAAKFHFRLKMTQLSELDPCMSFKEDEGASSQILDEHNRQSPSRNYLHADHSDFGEGRSISPRPESMDDLGGSRRDISPIDRSIETTPKKGVKPSPQSYREKASPRPGKDDNLQKSNTMQQKGRQMLTPNKRDQIVDDTPRFPNSQKRPASPFEQGNAKSAYSPHSDEVDQVRRSPTPTALGDARQIKQNSGIKESKSTDNLRTVNPKGAAIVDRNSPFKQQAVKNRNFLEENYQDTGSDSTEQYKAYERLAKEGAAEEERLVNTRPNDKNKPAENITRDENVHEGTREYYEEIDRNKQIEKRVKKWKVDEENVEFNAEKEEKNKVGASSYKDGSQEIDSRLSERNQPYEMKMKDNKGREENQYLEVAESDHSSSYEKLEKEHRPHEEIRRPDDQMSEKNKSFERLAKEYKQQLDVSHEEYLALSQKYEELKQTHSMLQIDYQTLQKGVANDRKSEKRADFELNIYKEKVTTLQKELFEQKAQNEDLLKNQRSQQSQHSKESKEAHDRSLDSEASDLHQPSSSTQYQESLQMLKRYEDIISSLRNELSDVRNKYEESQAQLQNQSLNASRNNVINERQTQSQNQNYNQILQQHQQNAFSKELEKSQITISELTSGINKLRRETEQKDSKIETLEGRIKELEDEVQFLKLQEERSKIQSLDLSDQSLEKINFDPKGSNETPENLQKNIQDLMVQNHGLKKELDQLKKILSLNNLDREKQKEELAALTRKNDEESEFEKKIAQLEAENARVASELKKAKMGWAAADIEKYNAITASKEGIEKAKKSEERVDNLEIEIFKMKSRLAELLNAIMEFGGVELLDRVEDIVSLDKAAKLSFREDLKKTVLK